MSNPTVFASRKTVCFSLVIAFLTLLTLASIASSQQIKVAVDSLTSPVRAGQNVKILIQTAAHARCEITVAYKSGPSPAQGLGPKSADRKGQVTWTWRVDSDATPGAWPITVTCAAGKQQGTLKTLLVVR